MQGVARNFFTLAVIYALFGMALGLHMAISQDHGQMPTHAHIMVAGWLMSSVFAFFYHLFPAVGQKKLAVVHFWLSAISGIGLMIGLFVLSSVMASLAGVISSLRTSAANPNSGTGYELEVIAMVVIGGTALTGGRGTIIGTVLGILILRVMRNGIVLIGVPGLAYNIFIGAIILGMMALHSWLERRHQAGT